MSMKTMFLNNQLNLIIALILLTSLSSLILSRRRKVKNKNEDTPLKAPASTPPENQTEQQNIALFFGTGLPHSYVFNLPDIGEVAIASGVPIYNFKTFLRAKDESDTCDCGKKLKNKTVIFGLNGSGRTLPLNVQYCPKCGTEPAESSPLWVAQNNQLIYI